MGQQLTPAQLRTGESFTFASSNAAVLEISVLVMDSASTGIYVGTGPAPAGGLSQVNMGWQQLGPRSGRIRAMWPPSALWPSGKTNTYLLVYQQPHSGLCQEQEEAGMSAQGLFQHDQSLIGQTVAPAELKPGESYHFDYVGQWNNSQEGLVLSAAANGWFIDEGDSTEAGIWEASVQYRRLSAVSAQLDVTWRPDPVFPETRLRSFVLVYTARDGGWFEGRSEMSSIGTGQFLRSPP